MEGGNSSSRMTWTTKVTAYLFPTALVIAILYFTPIWSALTTPSGRDIPESGPDEGNRIYHPFGFSIVAPENWDSLVWVPDTEASFPASINMYPGGGIPRRYSGSIGVFMHDAPLEDIADYTSETFQGQAAFTHKSSHPDGGFENPGQYGYSLVFQREDNWYRIVFHIFKDMQQVPVAIQPYLESFRIHNRPQAANTDGDA